jgi:metal-responsive CopG/Arc/MetJ family transcriptional regulator
MADTRFEVRLNDRLAKDFDAIAAEAGLSRADVFRRAIALYQVAKRAELGKGHVIIRTKEGTEQELVSL